MGPAFESPWAGGVIWPYAQSSSQKTHGGLGSITLRALRAKDPGPEKWAVIPAVGHEKRLKWPQSQRNRKAGNYFEAGMNGSFSDLRRENEFL